MRIGIDRERCIGAGMCALTAPAVFDQDPGDGRVVAATTDPTPPDHAAVREAVSVCPSGALTLES
ncbi:ferredoxin [Nocardia nova]|uniref:ferredoxin n=1 Tax=Nocardia nova TaxID=37330 RepID=UPI0033CB661C